MDGEEGIEGRGGEKEEREMEGGGIKGGNGKRWVREERVGGYA